MKGLWVLLAVVGAVAVAGIVFIVGTGSGKFEQDVQHKLEETGLRQKVEDAVRELEKTVQSLGAKIGEKFEQLKQSPEARELMETADVAVRDFKAELSQTTSNLRAQWGRLSEEGREKAAAVLERIQKEAGRIEASASRTLRELKTEAPAEWEKGRRKVRTWVAELEELTRELKQLPHSWDQ